MSIANIQLSDAEDGTVEVVITATNPREHSNALGISTRIQEFITELVGQQAKAEATPSSIIVEHLITCPHCMGAVDLRTAN